MSIERNQGTGLALNLAIGYFIRARNLRVRMGSTYIETMSTEEQEWIIFGEIFLTPTIGK